MTMQISLKDSGVHAESVEYAKAPSTPGLVQEPNLPCVQEALACDDHLESEDRNSNELVAAENGHHVRDLEVKQAKPLGKLCQFDAYDIKVFRGHQMVQTE
ncbi:sister chromatid cohesion 1 protein 4-like isoform X3 [Pistacia vera]|uniref:sister chromatid cohesion 1 protein 4-like isoform X3 n=1 Tax=Pistacia vera TaxID=55513 RepID=UPI00126319AB|nr:sister chromatid cohesion 1 protein 4-like isoform X3 [Pistacia vera]